MRNDWLETNIKATEELLFLLYKQREDKLQQRLTEPQVCATLGKLKQSTYAQQYYQEKIRTNPARTAKRREQSKLANKRKSEEAKKAPLQGLPLTFKLQM